MRFTLFLSALFGVLAEVRGKAKVPLPIDTLSLTSDKLPELALHASEVTST